MMLTDLLYRSLPARRAAKRLLPLLVKYLPRQVQSRLRLEVEKVIYRNVLDVHELPDAFHYWSERHLAPKLRQYGFSNALEFYQMQLALLHRQAGRTLHVMSLGSGNASLEIALCANLRKRGVPTEWTCVELNATLQEYARAAAEREGVGNHFSLVIGRAEDGVSTRPADAIIANQFLHHVQGVASFMGALRGSLHPDGLLLTHDVIGRNGHLLWANARERVESVWERLDSSKKVDRDGAHIEQFSEIDCSLYSLEGIEAGSVLPELMRNFQPRFFFGYGAYVLTFVDRRFGRNYDPAHSDADAHFIDALAEDDWRAVHNGELAPTQMFGAFSPTAIDGHALTCNVSPEHALLARA